MIDHQVTQTTESPIPVPRRWLSGELRMLGLTFTEQALFLALWARTREGDGMTTDASVHDLSEELKLSRETVSRTMSRLVQKGFVARERRHGETTMTRIRFDSIADRTATLRRFVAP